MIRIICVLLFLVQYGIGKGQVSPLVTKEYMRGLNPVDEIPLFNTQEIKERRIDTAYVIYHPGSWSEYHPTINPCNCTFDDTLSRYCFDTQGRIIEYLNYIVPIKHRKSIYYDTLGRNKRFNYDADTVNYKSIITRKKRGNDSLTVSYYLLKFKKGLDTAIIEHRRYNVKGKLIESKSEVVPRNEYELDDDTREYTYHYKYDFDDQGRLIYYYSVGSGEYTKISYPPYGKLTEIFDITTNQVKEREVKLISNQRGYTTITYDTKQITLVPLEAGSKLFKLINFIDPGVLTLMYFHEIVYKYHD